MRKTASTSRYNEYVIDLNESKKLDLDKIASLNWVSGWRTGNYEAFPTDNTELCLKKIDGKKRPCILYRVLQKKTIDPFKIYLSKEDYDYLREKIEKKVETHVEALTKDLFKNYSKE